MNAMYEVTIIIFERDMGLNPVVVDGDFQDAIRHIEISYSMDMAAILKEPHFPMLFDIHSSGNMYENKMSLSVVGNDGQQEKVAELFRTNIRHAYYN
jgi:hypothetical protein